MASLTLGLDLGPDSIGWALIDEENEEIHGTGVRIFPEGVDRDNQGGEKSKSQTRRVARGARRQIARRAKRKRRLRAALVDAGLLPGDDLEFEQLMQCNPYQLRRRALEEPLTPHEFGRLLVHLAQRRGFLSNRKTDKPRDKETKGMLAEIGALAESLAGRTLGQYLADENDAYNHCESDAKDRLRRRHTRRDMYEHEFEAIWEAQRKHHPDLLTDALKYGTQGRQTYPRRPLPLDDGDDLVSRFGIHGLIFFQRKMYWPRSVVGRCELEPKRKRCPKADRAAQRFRILQEVNNLRYLEPSIGEEHRLDDEQRAALVDHLAEKEDRSFTDIRKKLGLADSVQFNFERGDRTKLKGNETDAKLVKNSVLGKRWKELPEATKDAVVDILIREDREDVARQRLVADCGLSEEEAARAVGVHLPEGHVHFSRVAIDKLLPHLERGLMLMADDETNSALHAAGYLRPDQRAVNQQDFLPEPPDLANPIVRQAVFEVRKVVNAVLREMVYGAGHTLGAIHVELARDAKNSFEERRAIRIKNFKNRQAREKARKAIESYPGGIKPSRASINRYRLWEEQDETCVYCGQKISQAELFGGEADLDHILPRWRSLDDSLANKVICHRRCNAEKGDRTPREWLEDADPERYGHVLRFIKVLPYNKQLKFQRKEIMLEDFVERQLSDTRYISRCVSQYLRCLGAKVVCTRGQMTADVRNWWGLNRILDPALGRKNRGNHRHHAVDALVVALINTKRLHALANARGHDMPPPWKTFFDDARQAILSINVSHRARRRLHGALHEATLYGPTVKGGKENESSSGENRPWAKSWVEDENTFVRRKSIEELTNTKHLAKVRDPAIRKILGDHLRTHGIDPDKPGAIPKGVFNENDPPRIPPSRKRDQHLPGMPIRRVRMLEESHTFRQVSDRRESQYVKPGNNHHIVYHAKGEGDDEKWTAEVVTMWEAARRARSGQPMVDRDENEMGRFVMSLSIGEMFQIEADDGEILLCVVRKIDQRSRRVYYKPHTDAREAKEVDKDNLYFSEKNMQNSSARKVVVDPLGRLRSAGD